MTKALFDRLLGANAPALAPQVRAMHTSTASVHGRGCASVAGSSGLPARIVRAASGLPSPTAETSIKLTIERMPTGERWIRDFASSRRAMISYLKASRRWSDAFDERVGPAMLTFAPIVDNGGLRWETRKVRVFALPLPLRWFRGIEARCGERDGRYVFDVRVRLPLIGLLVAYSGWLEIVGDD